MQLSITLEGFELIKQDEENRFKELEEKNIQKIINIENTLEKLLLIIDMQKMM